MTRRLVLLALALVAACSSGRRSIRIPDSVVPNPRNKDNPNRAALQPYVIKVSDGKNTYQVEIPVAQVEGGPMTAAIPLDLERYIPEESPATEADREILDDKKAKGEPVPKQEPGQPAKSKSYLKAIARTGELYKKRQYELALIELTALDREYPDDERILAMKGTLYSKLGRLDQARQAWERVLALNPDNTQVAQALEQLNEEGE